MLRTRAIWAYGGNVTINGAVTGSGAATISGGATLEFGAASSADVTFAAGIYSTLALDNPNAYTGQIFGFTGTSPQQSDAIDLKGIAFDAGTSWLYQDNAGFDTGGTLTIVETVNGTTAPVYSITFANGDYTTANFHLATDGSGGTLVTDPPADFGQPAPINCDNAPLTGTTGIITNIPDSDTPTVNDGSSALTALSGLPINPGLAALEQSILAAIQPLLDAAHTPREFGVCRC